MDHCAECGFGYGSLAAGEVPGRLRGAGGRFAAALAAVGDPRRRPRPGVWSALEYACHVRDVLRVQKERLGLALDTDKPVFAPMRRDELVVRDAYNEQDPAVVLAELAVAAEEIADAFAALGGRQWERTGVYNWPETAERSMLWLGRHTVHEVEHHLMDVRRAG